MRWLDKRRKRLLEWLCPTCAEQDVTATPPSSEDGPETDETSKAPAEREPEPEADEEGVAALLLIAKDAVDDERERGRALDTKTASLVGATGLILSLNATLGRPLLDQKLGGVGVWFVRFFFVVAVVFLFLALLVGIVGVLAPQASRGLHRRQLKAFTSAQTQAMTRLAVHQALLGSLDDIMHSDRPVNDCKARLTTMVAYLFAFGFAGVAGEALTLWFHKAFV